MEATRWTVVRRPHSMKHNPTEQEPAPEEPPPVREPPGEKPPKQDPPPQEPPREEPPQPEPPVRGGSKALVVDVPMPKMEALLAQRSAEIQALMRRAEEEQALKRNRGQLCPSQCTHVRANGQRCTRAAAPGMDECEWHFEWYSRFPAITQMPYPEDGISIQHVLARTVAMVLNQQITPAHACAVAKLCREMRANLGRFEWEMARAEWVSG